MRQGIAGSKHTVCDAAECFSVVPECVCVLSCSQSDSFQFNIACLLWSMICIWSWNINRVENMLKNELADSCLNTVCAFECVCVCVCTEQLRLSQTCSHREIMFQHSGWARSGRSSQPAGWVAQPSSPSSFLKKILFQESYVFVKCWKNV